MSIYIGALIIVTIFSIINTRFYKDENDLGTYKTNTFGVGFSIIVLSLIASLRWYVGTDFDTYIRIFNNINNMDFIEAVLYKNTEPLFNLTTWIIMKITGQTQLVFAFYSILIISLTIMTLKRESSIFPLSLYIYITSMSYFNSFNGIRQYVAAAILFYAYKNIYTNRNKYFRLVIIATLFHSSAIIMIPLYYIVKRNFFSRINFIIGIISIIFTIFFNKFVSKLIYMLKFTNYYIYVGRFETDGGGANIMRLIIALIPLIFAIINYKHLKNKREDIDLLINFSFLNALILLISTRNWIFARISPYFSIYNIILIPEFLKIKNKYLRYLILSSVIILFFILMIILLPRESDLIPYKTIFMN